MEQFLLGHGDRIIDILGAEVDRLERRVKVSYNMLLLSVSECDNIERAY